MHLTFISASDTVIAVFFETLIFVPLIKDYDKDSRQVVISEAGIL